MIVAETHLWYKAGALEAIKYTHVPILVSGVPCKIRGCLQGLRGGLTRDKELP